MSFIDTARRLGRHRSATPAELRQENQILLAREVAAADFFTLLIQDRDEVHAAWEQARGWAADAELVVVCQQADIEELQRENAALRAQLANAIRVDVPPMVRDTTNGADPATAPVDVQELRTRFTAGPVVTLARSPHATDPAHIPAPAS
ncbi:hypothetical protein AB0I93_26990 [Streptomyces sp. NPDC049967]|uniref:hypothetical protein n=1 Tax=Streptomyces sp. NPDC049967 TaxID=3155658 RepID=UPI00343ACB22